MNVYRKAWSICAALMCLMMLIVSTAEAGIVFFDDFEDDTVGLLPVVSGSNVGGSYGSPNNTVAVGTNPEANGNSSAQVFVGAGASTLGNHIPALFISGAKPIDGMTVSYDFYSSAATGHDNDGVRVSLVGDADGNRDVFIRNDRDTAIIIDGAGQAEVNFGAEAWQNFNATFTATDALLGEYDLTWTITNLETSATISNTQAVTVNTANFTSGNARGISLEIFEGNAGPNNFTGYIDNVSVVAVPEPSAVFLSMAAATCVGAVRRWRQYTQK